LHPVVLSLAVPPNALSQREGIRWSDPVGLEIARRVDPTVEYLDHKYERALRTYYASLWRKYPREMRDIYLAKWRLAMTGTASFVDANMSPFAKRLFGPMQTATSGFAFTALFLVLTMTGLYLALRHGPGAGVLVATLGVAGVWVAIESAII